MKTEGYDEYLADLRARQARVRPHGTPSEAVYPLGEISVPDHVAHWARLRPDRAAVVFEDRTLTYRELDELSRRLAGRLAAEGVAPGDRVAVHLPNCPQFLIAFLAILRLGAVHVPVNPMFQSAELAYELQDSGAETVVTLDTFLPLLASVREQTAVRRVFVTTLLEMTDAGEAPEPEAVDGLPVHTWAQAVAHEPVDGPPADLDALAALNYTGGTSGLPKGCMHSQRHMIYTIATSAGATRQTADGEVVILCYIPIFWIAGEDLGILNPLMMGGTSVLLPRWDPARVLRAVDAHKVTTMVGTVENYLELLARPDFASYDLGSLVDPLCTSFIRKLDVEVRRAWTAAAGPHSVLREAAYGMTETHTIDVTPYGFQDGDHDLHAEPVFCGLPMPGTDIAVVSPVTGEPLPLGEAGEIIVRSPSVTTGYWNKPDATARQLRDGWLHTGDNGRIDEDGCLHYLGRDKDLIKVKGMSVFPAEVEMLLCRHPEVHTAAVVPAADATRGQVPVAFVTLRQKGSVDASVLREWARESMAPYKVPLVEIVEEMPMTTTMKIRKVDLAARAQQLADGSRHSARGPVRQ
ncbi:acyl-CoA synthetase [Streptomyces antnestii]|uniref:Acyl-CoA synthetase n=1 Tax=Streptomyces antnestii TaxID=2494256 RepID=A0A3S2VVP0_9ACTN|nr:AMP-binding protein [Streptomyces sp. San01]RVU22311.1 acyl-CoA synthetase [Streptomyces sp. San01]